jgi:type IV secretory pathway TrbF-like protein
MIKSRRMWAGRVACMGGMRNVQNILVRKPERKTPLGRSRSRWTDNIGMDLRQSTDWMHLAQDRNQWCALVKMVMNLLVP